MADLHTILLLTLQTTLAIASLELLRRVVLPRFEQLQTRELIVDVWCPVALILPMLFFATQVSGSVRGAGWMVTGGPAMCAVLATGAALLVRTPNRNSLRLANPGWVLIACAAAGFILLLLGLAHDLTIWIGQCSFAAGAVVLRMNTPELAATRQQRDEAPQVQSDSGFGMFVVLVCALAQGIVSIYLPHAMLSVSAAMIIATAAMMLAIAARFAGPDFALRIGCWAAVYGISFGLGIVSITAMIPQVMHILRDEPATRIIKIANGFGIYAPEAMLLIGVAGLLPFATLNQSSTRSRILGLVLIIIAALFSGWRLSV